MSNIPNPIPISDTETSKHLRIAVAESVITKIMSENILQPLSTIEAAAKSELEPILYHMFMKDPRRECILRSLLLAA